MSVNQIFPILEHSIPVLAKHVNQQIFQRGSKKFRKICVEFSVEIQIKEVATRGVLRNMVFLEIHKI